MIEISERSESDQRNRITSSTSHDMMPTNSAAWGMVTFVRAMMPGASQAVMPEPVSAIVAS
jgi:hypothetical protein